jgi:3-methyl-2-oxobutanoate hydroxymethyltransferase
VDMGIAVGEAAAAYARDVRAGSFPSMEHCFGVKK